MTLLSLFSVLLLCAILVWLFWPVVVDPIAQKLSRRSNNDADELANQLFDVWSKYGRGTPFFAPADRS